MHQAIMLISEDKIYINAFSFCISVVKTPNKPPYFQYTYESHTSNEFPKFLLCVEIVSWSFDYPTAHNSSFNGATTYLKKLSH